MYLSCFNVESSGALLQNIIGKSPAAASNYLELLIQIAQELDISPAYLLDSPI